jgi:hypothetical protein
MSTPILNKVSESGIITLDLELYYPSKDKVIMIDLKDYLFMGLILKEKDFRESLKNLDLSIYTGSIVGITCSAEAIIPQWAYMLLSAILTPVAKAVIMAEDENMVRQKYHLIQIQQLDISNFQDKRMVIKGCGEEPMSSESYLAITNRLMPIAKSIMYGEPCSTVPVYKRSV